MLVAEGAETRFAQTAAPSFRYKPPDFFTQKKRGRSCWFWERAAVLDRLALLRSLVTS